MHEEDLNLILEMGANTIRLAHYQGSNVYPLLTDDNTADEDLDKPNSLLISVGYTRDFPMKLLPMGHGKKLY